MRVIQFFLIEVYQLPQDPNPQVKGEGEGHRGQHVGHALVKNCLLLSCSIRVVQSQSQETIQLRRDNRNVPRMSVPLIAWKEFSMAVALEEASQEPRPMQAQMTMWLRHRPNLDKVEREYNSLDGAHNLADLRKGKGISALVELLLVDGYQEVSIHLR